jgi:putative acetyltransferase
MLADPMLSQHNAIKLQWATPDHFDDLGEVMFDAVRNGPSPYSEAQRLAWIPSPPNDLEWHERLRSQQIILSMRDKDIVGFMSLADQGYVDFAYIRPSFQKSGLFRKLYENIEQLALRQQHNRLWVHASVKAQPAFSAVGFQIIKSEEVKLGDQKLERFEMEKLFD